MLRYYYDCPLKAAYMAKYFGMKFEGGYTAQFLALDAASQIRDKNERDYYYIHPDSLHLLEPRDDDIGCREIVYEDGERWRNPAQYNEELKKWEADEGLDMGECKTLQRDGKSFMWPEQE